MPRKGVHSLIGWAVQRYLYIYDSIAPDNKGARLVRLQGILCGKLCIDGPWSLLVSGGAWAMPARAWGDKEGRLRPSRGSALQLLLAFSGWAIARLYSRKGVGERCRAGRDSNGATAKALWEVTLKRRKAIWWKSVH